MSSDLYSNNFNLSCCDLIVFSKADTLDFKVKRSLVYFVSVLPYFRSLTANSHQVSNNRALIMRQGVINEQEHCLSLIHTHVIQEDGSSERMNNFHMLSHRFLVFGA